MINIFLTELVIIRKSNTTELVSINEDNVIKITFTSGNLATKKVDSNNDKVNEVNIVDIANPRSVKISFQSRFIIAKSKNLV